MLNLTDQEKVCGWLCWNNDQISNVRSEPIFIIMADLLEHAIVSMSTPPGWNNFLPYG